MKSELLAKSPLLALPLVAFVLFVVVFVSIFILTMKKKPAAYEPIARLPLDDADERGANGGSGGQSTSSLGEQS